ncbi:NUDIX hydrolase [Roseobacter sinensis]|uniref:NUDIX hydrolase n=1 Tax=Roseobacter sinensis TaxID=2931391 RepID=A0ABT3BG27_9RHOB|nr:NUDIX hydrolase [Roseobacter sp. WL0113]MCV3272535.1 NUDIX hydrolase [Roseobacter sp. WL0113]
MIKQLPIFLSGAGKRDVRTQFAALCYRVRKSKVQVLLITSRGTKRWIVPKGWPIDGLTPAACAEQEAWEEAGVQGRTDGRCLGIFSFSKDADDLGALPCLAMVYAVEVKTLAAEYPEVGQRRRKWMSRKKAARLVSEPELARILRDFDPPPLSGQT